MVFVLAQTVAVFHVCAVMPYKHLYRYIYMYKNYNEKKYIPATSITNSITV